MAENAAATAHPARPASEGLVAAGTSRPSRLASEGLVAAGMSLPARQASNGVGAAGTLRPARPASEGVVTPQPGLAEMGKVAPRILIHPTGKRLPIRECGWHMLTSDEDMQDEDQPGKFDSEEDADEAPDEQEDGYESAEEKASKKSSEIKDYSGKRKAAAGSTYKTGHSRITSKSGGKTSPSKVSKEKESPDESAASSGTRRNFSTVDQEGESLMSVLAVDCPMDTRSLDMSVMINLQC
ncbi:hypothetical protein ACQ4PT_016667 [Festuca glaucescens]